MSMPLCPTGIPSEPSERVGFACCCATPWTHCLLTRAWSAHPRLHRFSDDLLLLALAAFCCGLALAAFCCGAEGFQDIQNWANAQGQQDLRRDFGARLDNGIPHHDTFRRVLARLEPVALEATLHLVRQRDCLANGRTLRPNRSSTSPGTARNCAAPTTPGARVRPCCFYPPLPPTRTW